MHFTRQCSHGNSSETALSQQIVYWSFCRTVNIRVFKRSIFVITLRFTLIRGPGSSVGIATNYGLNGLGSNPGGRDFPPVQTGPGAHPASCKMGTGSLSGVKCGRGVLLTTHPF